MDTKKLLLAACLTGPFLVTGVSTAATTTLDVLFTGANDCKGYFNGPDSEFGTGFSACEIFATEDGEAIKLSPVIVKFAANLTVSEVSTDFPTIDGDEFTFSNTGTDNSTGDWVYAPDANDPGIRYWVAKAGGGTTSGFTLFWDVDTSSTVSGGVCDAAGDIYTVACLNEAIVQTSGSWSTPLDKELSHLTFYDTEPPVVVPLPAAVWLFGSALVGLVALGRRKGEGFTPV